VPAGIHARLELIDQHDGSASSAIAELDGAFFYDTDREQYSLF
jgi:hypothetical protein